jgi:hypothetical protein
LFLYAGPAGRSTLDAFIDDTQSALRLSKIVSDLPVSGEVAHHVELYGAGYSIFVINAPDQRCYVSGLPTKITYNKGIYDVVVARTGLLPPKAQISEIVGVLEGRAHVHGVRLSTQDEAC